MTARERAEQLYQELLTDSVPDAVTRLTAALADAERGVWRVVWNESVRIQGNGSPLTDFGKGVIAATKDIQTFICKQSEAQPVQGPRAIRVMDDEIYEKAKVLVISSGKVSPSLIQRRLMVGYSRAVEMIKRMEVNGIISGDHVIVRFD